MSLRKIKFEKSYDSSKNVLLEDFYIPVLGAAKEYWRVTGYFSSNSLTVAAKGIGQLIKNNGKMKLITGFFTNKEDVDAAISAIENPEKVIKDIDRIIESEDILDAFPRESLKALSWMLAKEYLEIKVALVKPDDLDRTDFIFHPKIGVVIDNNNDKISFEGSINETGVAWLKNYESFKVFKSWDDSQKGFIEPDITRFSKLWNNLDEKVEVVSLPEAIKNKLIRIGKQQSEEKINFEILNGNINIKRKKTITKKEKIILRDHQIPALNKWIENNNSGIIEMATGTGKTYVGLAALEYYIKNVKKGISIVCAPRKEICDQWKKKIKYHIEFDSAIFVGGGKNKWIGQAENILHDFIHDRKNSIVFISTYDSLKDILKLITLNNISNVFLLADEVHTLGAKEKKKLICNPEFVSLISYKMGLSATPDRMYDIEGNEAINNFFKKTVYKYSLAKAIKHGILCKYEYKINLIEMTSNEFDDYISSTKKIAKAYHAVIDSALDEDVYSALLNKRANIVKQATNKFIGLEQIIKELLDKKDISFSFIFCINTEQKNHVIEILEEFSDILYSQITGDEDSAQRAKILDAFSNERIHLLLSMKILDEGVDIPSAKNAIILSSSTNPREYIQRRGRVLRKAPDEEKIAKIIDFVVVPSFDRNVSKELYKIERRILIKELKRAFYFAKSSRNRVDLLRNKQLNQIIERYELGEVYDELTKDDD